MVKKVLTIAGSDCSGGAGIQADLKTFQAFGTYGMSVITSLTAQNTTGVQGIFDVDPEFVARQIDSIFQDIIPDAVKIGMLSNAGIVHVVSEKMRRYRVTELVIDPVMVSTSGSRLLSQEACGRIQEELLPLAKLVTPNIPEAEVLLGRPVKGQEDMQETACLLADRYHCFVLLKGGHSVEGASDVLAGYRTSEWYHGKRSENTNTHGTGCTLSSAIAAGLALGLPLPESIRRAKRYLYCALESGLNLGRGSGPVDHLVQGWQD